MKKHCLYTISLLCLWMPTSICQASQELELGTYTKFHISGDGTNPKTYNWLLKQVDGLLLTKKAATYNKRYKEKKEEAKKEGKEIENLYFLSLEGTEALSKQKKHKKDQKRHIHVIATKKKYITPLPISKLGFSKDTTKEVFTENWDPKNDPVVFKPKYIVNRNSQVKQINYNNLLPDFSKNPNLHISVYGSLIRKSDASNAFDNSEDFSDNANIPSKFPKTFSEPQFPLNSSSDNTNPPQLKRHKDLSASFLSFAKQHIAIVPFIILFIIIIGIIQQLRTTKSKTPFSNKKVRKHSSSSKKKARKRVTSSSEA